MKSRSLLVGLVSALVLGIAVPAASAADFCVGVSLPRCPAAEYSLNTTGLFGAEDDADANPGPDTVVIAPHVFDLLEPLNMVPAADTTLLGAGVGQTVFQGAYPGEDLISFSGEPGSKARGFSVLVNDESAGGTGLSVTGSTVSDFSVEKVEDFPSNSVGFRGLEIGGGGTAHDGTITIATFAGVGIYAGYQSGTAHDIEVRTTTAVNSGTGIYANSSDAGTDLNFHHMRIKGFAAGVFVDDKKLTLTDSLIDMGAGTNMIGIGASAFDGKSIEIEVERVTVVGTGADQTAFALSSGDAPASIDAALYDFVAYAPQPLNNFKSIYCSGGAGIPQPVSLDVEYIAGWGGDAQVLPGCEWDLESEKAHDYPTHGEPEFRDFAGGDYRLLHTSPLIDKGDTQGSLAASATDLAGRKRAVDGNGDGTVRTDLGAFEYQRAAPQLSVAASATSVLPGTPITFTATANDPEGETFTLGWSFDDGSVAGNVGSVSHAFAGAGTHSATVTAVDQAGAQSTATATVVVNPFPDPVATARVTAKAKKSFKAGKKGFSIAKKGQPSFSVAFTGAAKAKFTLKRFKGKKLNSVKGSQTLSVKNGTAKFFFGGKRLKPGRYRVSITPISPSGVPGKSVSTSISLK